MFRSHSACSSAPAKPKTVKKTKKQETVRYTGQPRVQGRRPPLQTAANGSLVGPFWRTYVSGATGQEFFLCTRWFFKRRCSRVHPGGIQIGGVTLLGFSRPVPVYLSRLLVWLAPQPKPPQQGQERARRKALTQHRRMALSKSGIVRVDYLSNGRREPNE